MPFDISETTFCAMTGWKPFPYPPSEKESRMKFEYRVHFFKGRLVRKEEVKVCSHCEQALPPPKENPYR